MRHKIDVLPGAYPYLMLLRTKWIAACTEIFTHYERMHA